LETEIAIIGVKTLFTVFKISVQYIVNFDYFILLIQLESLKLWFDWLESSSLGQSRAALERSKG